MFRREIHTCCASFRDLLDNAGQRGLSVIVVADADTLRFRMQSRGIAYGEESLVREAPDTPDVLINISRSVAVQFCPFCGTRLSKLLKRGATYYAALAAQHAEFYERLIT